MRFLSSIALLAAFSLAGQSHEEADIIAYGDKPLLTQDIQRVDEIYLWFVRVRETRDRKNGTR